MVFTVFTPTYNRENTLNRVYNSLLNQSFKDFEWLIVDDGSTDGTQLQVNKWAQEAPFTIRYYFQQNQGKHIAFNYGVSLASGELFITFDSDDACVPDALEVLYTAWIGIPESDRWKYSAVTGLCVDQNGNLVGDKYPTSPFDSDSLESFYKYKVKGEKWGFQRLDVLKYFPFPVHITNQYIEEGFVWTKISKEYKTRYINSTLRIYYVNEGESLMSTRGNPFKNLAGKIENQLFKLNNHYHYFKFAPIYFFGSACLYVRYSTLHGVPVMIQQSRISKFQMKVLFFLAFGPGIVLALYDKLRV